MVLGIRVTSSPNGSAGLAGAGDVGAGGAGAGVAAGGAAGAGAADGGVAGAWAREDPGPASARAATTNAADNDLPRQCIDLSCGSERPGRRMLVKPVMSIQPAATLTMPAAA